MKKITALIIIFIIAISMVSIGAWAYFTDTESTDMAIMAGTLDLLPGVNGIGATGKYTVIPGGNQVNGYAVFENILPGESGEITWVLVNNGSLAGLLSSNSSIIFSDVSQNEVENAVPGNNSESNGDLDDCIGIKLEYGLGADQTSAEANFTYLLGSTEYFQPLKELETVLNLFGSAMSANGGADTVVFKLTWIAANDIKMAGTDGIFGTVDDIEVNENIIQSDNAQIDITFILTQ